MFYALLAVFLLYATAWLVRAYIERTPEHRANYEARPFVARHNRRPLRTTKHERFNAWRTAQWIRKGER